MMDRRVIVLQTWVEIMRGCIVGKLKWAGGSGVAK
jgi:hypothetical protein